MNAIILMVTEQAAFPQERTKLTSKALESEVLRWIIVYYNLLSPVGFLNYIAWHFLMGAGGLVETLQFNKMEAFSQPKL